MYPGLVELRLANVEKLTDGALRAIAQHLPKLHLLDLQASRGISDSGVIELAQKCTALKALNLCETSITDAAITAIANNCGDLEALVLQNCENLTDAALQVVTLPKLTKLYLDDCPAISDAGLIELSRQCTALKSLSIRSTSITDAAVSAVARNCPDLEELQVENSQVTDESIISLLQHCAHLTQLDFDRTGITLISDAGVVELVQKCTALKHLDLSGNLITDAAITAIANNCGDLEELVVENCDSITDAALR
ncbi:hypothetical protein AURANDRAFT_28949, partial [Aureococcus anophagefferens]